MRSSVRAAVLLVLLVAAALLARVRPLPAQAIAVHDSASGVTLAVDDAFALPVLRITLPGQPAGDPGIVVIFPEHVTALPHGAGEPTHLYLFQPGARGQRPAWRVTGRSLEYEMELPGGVHLTARATLDADGVRYGYRLVNRSGVPYDNIQAVTDPRLLSPLLHDVRLARTYVHHPAGFDLLASETPARLAMPLAEWLPNRYRVPFRWPVDAQRVARQPDGITWYNKSRAVDEPFIATKSVAGGWVIATFSRDAGNVWTNPDLTCQHADPSAPLAANGASVLLEEKTLIVRGTLDDALASIRRQRGTLQPKTLRETNRSLPK